MRRTAALTVLPALAVVALLGSACSSDENSEDSTTTSTTEATSTTTSGSGGGTTASTGSTTTTRAGTPACNTSQLQGELGPTNAGAGQLYAPLILRNTSSTTCEVTGFPG